MINVDIHSTADFWLGFGAGCFLAAFLVAILAPIITFVIWPFLVRKFRKKEPPRKGGGLLI